MGVMDSASSYSRPPVSEKVTRPSNTCVMIFHPAVSAMLPGSSSVVGSTELTVMIASELTEELFDFLAEHAVNGTTARTAARIAARKRPNRAVDVRKMCCLGRRGMWFLLLNDAATWILCLKSIP